MTNSSQFTGFSQLTDFSQFFTDPDMTPPYQMYLFIPSTPIQRVGKNSTRPIVLRSLYLPLPRAICHATFSLFQMWSVTGHGELSLRTKGSLEQNRLEVFLDSGITYRYLLRNEELQAIQDAYQHMHGLMLYKMYHGK